MTIDYFNPFFVELSRADGEIVRVVDWLLYDVCSGQVPDCPSENASQNLLDVHIKFMECVLGRSVGYVDIEMASEDLRRMVEQQHPNYFDPLRSSLSPF